MRKHLLSIFAIVLSTMASHAQTISDFEALSLSKPDTFYVNYSHPGHDVGFTDGLAYFSCVYDTGFGSSYWSSGFAYSNMRDSATSGYLNQYAAKAYTGYGGSNKYAVAYAGFSSVKVHLSGVGIGNSVPGFYVTNSTYAYNSMRDGDAFARKFGDSLGIGATYAAGHYPDWFKLTIKGYLGGVLKSNSVDFYLADYRSSTKYIVKDWQWVNLLPLGNLDSLVFSLSSSDTGMYGMNTPAYFCIDNFTVNDPSSVSVIVPAPIAKVYPNPAKGDLTIETSPVLSKGEEMKIDILNISGQKVFESVMKENKIVINTSELSPGIYLLQLRGDNKIATVRFVKQ